MTSNELKIPFRLPFDNFSEPIEWEDGVGFSTIEDAANGYASMYKVGLVESSKSPLRSLWISVSYGKKVDNGISLGTASEKFRAPVDLDFRNEFFYNEQNQKFYYKKEEIVPRDILLKIKRAHTLPTKNFKGITLRFKLWFWRYLVPTVVKVFDKILIFILWVISGEKTQEDIFSRGLFERPNERIRNKSVEFEESKTMEFFGYKAKRWSVVFYCALHLIIYFIFLIFTINHAFWGNLSRINFLSLCYVVVSFAFTEYLAPRVLKKIIKSTPQLYGRIAFKKLKVTF